MSQWRAVEIDTKNLRWTPRLRLAWEVAWSILEGKAILHNVPLKDEKDKAELTKQDEIDKLKKLIRRERGLANEPNDKPYTDTSHLHIINQDRRQNDRGI